MIDAVPIAFLPFGLPDDLLAAYERGQGEQEARDAAKAAESNVVVWGVDFANKRRS